MNPERLWGGSTASPSYHETAVNAAGQAVAVDTIYWLLSAAAKVTSPCVASTASTSVFVVPLLPPPLPSPLNGVGRVGWKTALGAFSWTWFLLLALLVHRPGDNNMPLKWKSGSPVSWKFPVPVLKTSRSSPLSPAYMWVQAIALSCLY